MYALFLDDILCLGTNEPILVFNGSKITYQLIILIFQPGYIESILDKFQVLSSVPIIPSALPMSSTDMIDDNPVPSLKQDQQLFMQLVGCLLLLSTRSCPDLSFSINDLTIFMSKATYHHIHIGYKILRYIHNTKYYKLQFHGNEGIHFNVMVDSSSASHADRKSLYDSSVHLNSGSGSCIIISKKDKLIALSYRVLLCTMVPCQQAVFDVATRVAEFISYIDFYCVGFFLLRLISPPSGGGPGPPSPRTGHLTVADKSLKSTNRSFDRGGPGPYAINHGDPLGTHGRHDHIGGSSPIYRAEMADYGTLDP